MGLGCNLSRAHFEQPDPASQALQPPKQHHRLRIRSSDATIAPKVLHQRILSQMDTDCLVPPSLALGMLGTCAVYHICLILWFSVSFWVK